MATLPQTRGLGTSPGFTPAASPPAPRFRGEQGVEGGEGPSAGSDQPPRDGRDKDAAATGLCSKALLAAVCPGDAQAMSPHVTSAITGLLDDRGTASPSEKRCYPKRSCLHLKTPRKSSEGMRWHPGRFALFSPWHSLGVSPRRSPTGGSPRWRAPPGGGTSVTCPAPALPGRARRGRGALWWPRLGHTAGLQRSGSARVGKTLCARPVPSRRAANISRCSLSWQKHRPWQRGGTRASPGSPPTRTAP